VTLPFFIFRIQIMIWKPNVTVAAVIERDGKFLLVEEETSQGLRLNQPAGHLEAAESLLSAVSREVLEESAYHFVPQHLLGIYRWHSSESGTTYLRFAFTGALTGHDPDRPLDNGILQALWLSPDEIRATQKRHRSPLILRCVEDYLAGKRYPLELLTHYV
jgi:8-oxo-dGTP pyrophosphatase MutT (NUDIX family)